MITTITERAFQWETIIEEMAILQGIHDLQEISRDIHRAQDLLELVRRL